MVFEVQGTLKKRSSLRKFSKKSVMASIATARNVFSPGKHSFIFTKHSFASTKHKFNFTKKHSFSESCVSPEGRTRFPNKSSRARYTHQASTGLSFGPFPRCRILGGLCPVYCNARLKPILPRGNDSCVCSAGKYSVEQQQQQQQQLQNSHLEQIKFYI